MGRVSIQKCRAKDPKSCRYHGVVDDSGVNQIIPTLDKPVPDPVFNGPMGSAMSSSLEWQGEKPKWWNKYVKSSESNVYAPSSPVLLDVIDSPMGKLAVVWEDNSQADGDKYSSLDSGMQVSSCSYISMDTGETLGYVKTSSINEESFTRSFGDDEFTIFRYYSRYTGYTIRELDNGEDKLLKSHNLEKKFRKSTSEADFTVDELRRKIWLRVSSGLGKSVTLIKEDGSKEYIPSYSLTEEHIPDDATVRSDLKEYEKQIRAREYVDTNVKHFEVPFVDYSSVSSGLKGSGFGSSLYVYTARVLGQRGQVLRGSGIQSNDAQGVWGRFKEKLPGHTGDITLKYRTDTNTAPVLDFRN